MLYSIKTLLGSKVQATNGEVGRLSEFYFDDQTWTVRYLLVDVGGWMGGPHTVYVSPLAVQAAGWGSRLVELSLSREQLAESPGMRTGLLVNRNAEAGYYQYHGWPYYWTGPARWGAWDTPAAAAAAPPAPRPDFDVVESGLRSAGAVAGYPVEATDGHIGRAEDFLMNDETWAIEKIKVDTTRWWPGGEVLITPAQVKWLDWSDHHLYVSLTRAEVKALPAAGSSG